MTFSVCNYIIYSRKNLSKPVEALKKIVKLTKNNGEFVFANTGHTSFPKYTYILNQKDFCVNAKTEAIR